jgi:hypothetical protein
VVRPQCPPVGTRSCRGSANSMDFVEQGEPPGASEPTVPCPRPCWLQFDIDRQPHLAPKGNRQTQRFVQRWSFLRPAFKISGSPQDAGERRRARVRCRFRRSQPSERNASSMSAGLSSRTRRRRDCLSQANVRSTTKQRQVPKPLPWLVRHIANSGRMPRVR